MRCHRFGIHWITSVGAQTSWTVACRFQRRELSLHQLSTAFHLVAVDHRIPPMQVQLGTGLVPRKETTPLILLILCIRPV